MYNLCDLTLLTSLASMGGLWAGLAGAVWQRTWVAAVYGHPKASPGRAPVSEIDESSWQTAGASLVLRSSIAVNEGEFSWSTTPASARSSP
jgi:hypothetical protein